MLSFLPGFTVLPASPFVRPDGADYVKNYTRVLYDAEAAEQTYRHWNVDYFLVDLDAATPLMWSGFSPLFAPETIASRFTIVRRYQSDFHNYYLLTWKNGAAVDELQSAVFHELWTRKLNAEKAAGVYHGQFEAGRLKLTAQSQ
jgi:hypothetical protein